MFFYRNIPVFDIQSMQKNYVIKNKISLKNGEMNFIKKWMQEYTIPG